MRFGFRTSLASFVLAFSLLQLSGCALESDAPGMPVAGTAIRGKVFGGNQPVTGAHVYLMAATVSGVGAAGYGLASTSLLSSAATGHSDSTGAYVLTDSNGSFSLDVVTGGTTTYDYTCPSATTQVYLYVLGGNPGAGTNNAASFMTALGSCGGLSSASFIIVNELTTVAAAYAVAGFATDALHISIPKYASATQQTNNITDALAQLDLQNAFANANNLVRPDTGLALTTTPAGNGTPTRAQVITIGNLLAACVNSNGTTTNPSNCYTLFHNAGSTGGATGTIPVETATVAINLAHHPYVSSAVMAALYALQPGTGAPFAGGDTAQPADFVVAINFTGGAGLIRIALAIDGAGNAWVTDTSSSTVNKFSPSGALLSGSAGFTGGGLKNPDFIAIDTSGNAWVANNSGNTVSEFSPTGTPLSGSGYTGGGLDQPYGVAIASDGNVWVSNLHGSSLSEFSSTGSAISGSSGYTGGGVFNPIGIALDSAGHVWTGNNAGNSLSEFSNTGVAISGSSGYTGGGLTQPSAIAFDNTGNVWVANSSNSAVSISEFSSIGVAISGSSGYTGGGLSIPEYIAIDGAGNAWVADYFDSSVSEFSSTGSPLSESSGYTVGGTLNQVQSIAIDGSGNVWALNRIGSVVTELMGAATPVVTPLVANLMAPYGTPASRP